VADRRTAAWWVNVCEVELSLSVFIKVVLFPLKSLGIA
jgi:hypothetical protein